MFERLSTLLIILELIEAGTGWSEQYDVSRFSGRRGILHGILDGPRRDDAGRFLGRIFMSDRKARRARNETQALLAAERVDLVNDAVDIERQRRALKRLRFAGSATVATARFQQLPRFVWQI